MVAKRVHGREEKSGISHRAKKSSRIRREGVRVQLVRSSCPLQCCRVAFSFFLSVVRRRRVGPNHNLALKGAARANHHIVSTHTFSHFSFPDFSSHPWTPNFHRNAALVGQTQKKVVQKTVALLPHLLTWVQMIVSLGLEE